MNTVYAKNDFLERENKRVYNKIKSVLSICSTPDFYCAQEHDVWGIWLKMDGKVFLVDLIELVNSIFFDNEYYMLDEYLSEENNFRTVEVKRGRYCYSWIITGDEHQNAVQLCFHLRDYSSKIKACVEELYEQWSHGGPIAYKASDFGIEAVAMALDQLDVEATLPSYFTLNTSKIKEETFIFNTFSHKHLEKYTIGIGNRKYDTWITHWDNNFNQIKSQFERFYYEREAEINLAYDMSYTVLKIKKVSVLDKVNETEGGRGFKYRDFALVEIQPNEFVHMPIIKGYCDLTQTIKALYEGLLLFALAHKVDQEDEDEPPRLEIYNIFKSPLIEIVIKGINPQWSKHERLQQHVKRIIKIDPNYDYFLIDDEDVACSLDDLYTRDGQPISLPAFEQWQQELCPIIIKSETGESYEKDWQDYHRRGLELAKQLREMLSPDFDLWYEAPYEDKSGIIPKPILII